MNLSRDLTSGQRGFSFLMVATGVFLATMDSSMINVALPTIMHFFSSTFTEARWVISIYLLTITISLLFWGHLSDRFGKGEIYLSGMLLFSAGSTGCGFSFSLNQLIFFRFVQAVGAAMMMSTGPAIIAQVFELKYLGRVLGLVGIATSAGLMGGPVVSGFLLHYSSWRALFFVTIPISFGMCLLGWFFVLPALSKSTITRKTPFNWKSFSCWSLLVVFLVILSSNAKNFQADTIIWYLLAVIITGLIFIIVEQKSKSPLLPLQLIKRSYFTVAMVTATISFTVLFIVIILIPFYLTFILELTTLKIGTVMMALPVALSLLSPLAGRLYDAIGAKKLTTTGLLICTVAIIFLSLLTNDSNSFDVMWRLALLGAGQSIFLSPNSASVLARVGVDYTGITSGILATSRNLGMLFGVTLAGMVFGFLFSEFSGGFDLNGFTSLHIFDFMRALQYSFSVAAVISFVGVVISTLR